MNATLQSELSWKKYKNFSFNATAKYNLTSNGGLEIKLINYLFNWKECSSKTRENVVQIFDEAVRSVMCPEKKASSLFTCCSIS